MIENHGGIKMGLNINIPAFLFSTISLLMSAYGSRFSKISKLIRDLSIELDNNNLEERIYLKNQILIFSKRVRYIKRLQLAAISSLFFSALSMFCLLFEKINFANITFIIALIFFLVSLLISLIEILYSIKALQINFKI